MTHEIKYSYDVIVVGAGPAGYVAAIITKGDQTLKLRGVNTGSRAWKGQGQRRL